MTVARGQSAEQKKQSKENFDVGRIYTAKIKDNRDPDRNGRLRVWLKESNYDETNPEKWVTVRYAPPFWGTTPDNRSDANSFENTKKSYGMWFVPPDIGNYVLVCFVGNNDAFWFASVPEAFMNNMVPGIPAEKTTASSLDDFPAAEYNRSLTEDSTTRPSHDPLSNGLLNQGLAADDVRGRTTSSARREAPSRTHGILTPRGNQMVMDDGWTLADLPDNMRSWLKRENRDPSSLETLSNSTNNPSNQNYSKTGTRMDEGIRFRTRNGTQILMSETYGHVYIITRDGESWIELNNDGNIDVYGSGSMNFHAEQNFNIRADCDVNIEAGRNINLKAAGDTGEGNIKIESAVDFDLVVHGKKSVFVEGNINFSTNAKWSQQSNSGMHLNSGSPMNLTSGGSLNLLAGGDIVQSGTNIHLNGPAAAVAEPPSKATGPCTFSEVNIKQRTVIANPATKTNSIVTDRLIETISPRIPTHEPWDGRGYENPDLPPLPRIER